MARVYDIGLIVVRMEVGNVTSAHRHLSDNTSSPRRTAKELFGLFVV
jgi:hypothetical protein